MGTIRTFCRACGQWTDVATNQYGSKFAAMHIDRNGEIDDRYFKDVEMFVEDSDDEYRCENCANKLEGRWTNEEILENLYDHHDAGLYDFNIETVEKDYPKGLPDWPEFCYDSDDARPPDVMLEWKEPKHE